MANCPNGSNDSDYCIMLIIVNFAWILEALIKFKILWQYMLCCVKIEEAGVSKQSCCVDTAKLSHKHATRKSQPLTLDEIMVGLYNDSDILRLFTPGSPPLASPSQRTAFQGVYTLAGHDINKSFRSLWTLTATTKSQAQRNRTKNTPQTIRLHEYS